MVFARQGLHHTATMVQTTICTALFARLQTLEMFGGKGRVGATNAHIYGVRLQTTTFAVRRLLNWYGQGMDVNKLLPQLSVYLGHAKPQNLLVLDRHAGVAKEGR
jgi:hypothetical protein